jgi:hypothetical protein
MIETSDTPVAPVIRIFADKGISIACLVPTATGMNKSITDATEWLRRLLREAEIHDYEKQGQGASNKVSLKASFTSDRETTDVTVTLYRPETKSGDPRIWIYGLKNKARAGNLLTFFVVSGRLNIVNASHTPTIDSLANPDSALSKMVARETEPSRHIAEELLYKLKILYSEGPIKTVTSGDTGVGMTLESALGVRPNSDKAPDYKGIERKASRRSLGKSKTRVNLFAQVPDWTISRYKSSSEILDAFGYKREDGVLRLNCTVSALAPNGQNLQLKVNYDDDVVDEFEYQNGRHNDVAKWRLEKLRSRIIEKHFETFWVKAVPSIHRGTEYFHYVEATHTQQPKPELFGALVADGTISVDHLIKRENGRASERGPLFKIWPEDLTSVLTKQVTYDLSQ